MLTRTFFLSMIYEFWYISGFISSTYVAWIRTSKLDECNLGRISPPLMYCLKDTLIFYTPKKISVQISSFSVNKIDNSCGLHLLTHSMNQSLLSLSMYLYLYLYELLIGCLYYNSTIYRTSILFYVHQRYIFLMNFVLNHMIFFLIFFFYFSCSKKFVEIFLKYWRKCLNQKEITTENLNQTRWGWGLPL